MLAAASGRKARSTSLSLKTTLVSGLLLAYGYERTHGATTAALACAEAKPLLQVAVTVLIVVVLATFCAVSVTIPPGGICVIGLPATVPILSSTTVTLFAFVVPVLMILYV